MLQALLIDRFQLKFHRESKEGPVYTLTKGNNALKLQAPKDKEDYSWAGGGGSGVRGINISMAQLADRMGDWLGRLVLDQTGIQGAYDFEYQTENEGPSVDSVSSIIQSLRELGLNLKAGKAPVESIIIDHVEKPSAN